MTAPHDAQKPGGNQANAGGADQKEQADFATDERAAVAPRQSALIAICDAMPGNATSGQEARLLAALEAGPLTTTEGRRDLDVMHPAGRVLGLRKRGVSIVTLWATEATDCGKLHRVARNMLERAAAGATP